ncbi:hypothetical protein [Actinocrispum sp. NPDC049592]|uniref:hypothetical protein n=1 Tax=Actinocrispum sp. NPDC049592 TaxID=3154835 RepID=UPI0034230874
MPPWLAPLSAVVGGSGLIGLHALRFGSWIVDDAAITFAYVRSIAQGDGPVLQPGAGPTEGFSNPSWLALLTVGRLVGLFDHGTILGVPDYVFFPKALALLCCAGILVAIYWAARDVAKRPALVTFLAGALLAAIPSFVVWCFSGLENPLYALVVTWLGAIMFKATVEDRLLTTRIALVAGALAAVAALTRPDGLIYGGAYPLVVLIQIRRATLRHGLRSVLVAVAAFAVIVGAYITWRYLEFGRLTSLPTVAKGQSLPHPSNLARAGELIGYVGALGALILAILIGMVMMRPSALRTAIVSFLVPLALAVTAYSVLAPDWMAQLRFATPVWVLVVIASVLCGEAVFRQFTPRGRTVLAAGVVLALVPAWSLFKGASDGFRAAPTVPMCTIAERPSRVDNVYADILGIQQGSLLTADVGATALTSRLRIIDLAGLSDSAMADFWADHRWDDLTDYVFDTVKPTFIEQHSPWSDGVKVSTDPRLIRDYVMIRREAGPPETADWVRKDAVPTQAKLEQLRAYGMGDGSAAVARAFDAPLRACGDTLRPGQWPS